MALFCAVLIFSLLSGCASISVPSDSKFVRLSKITVDPAKLDQYNAFVKEEIEESLRREPGVLALYAVSEKENPSQITILEVYADQTSYKRHIQTPHFKKYKEGTIEMLKELVLADVIPLMPNMTSPR